MPDSDDPEYERDAHPQPGSGPEPSSRPRNPTLREREQQIDAIARLLDGARHGAGGAAFVVGEAGTGKSSLLRVATEGVRDGMTVVSARGHAMEADLPFAFVEQFVGPVAAGIPPTHVASADPMSRRALVYEAALARLHSCAGGSGTLIVLDDLHWADPDSLAVVGFLARRLASLPVAFVAGLRPWPAQAHKLAQSVAHDGLGEVLRVGRLGEQSGAEMLEEMLGEPPSPSVVSRALSLSDGNPYLLVAAADTVRTEGDLPDTPASAPSRLKSALLLSHLAGLSPTAVGCAQVAAVLGDHFRLDDAEAVGDASAEVFADAIDTLVSAGILTVDGPGRLRYTHDLLAVAINDDTPPARRRLLRRRAFERFAETGQSELATSHALTADIVGDQRAVQVAAEAAARALAAGGVASALDHLAAAAHLAGPRPPEDVLVRRADLLLMIGQPSDALAAYRELLAREDTGRRVEILASAARAQALVGGLDEPIGAYDEILGDSVGLSVESTPIVMERAHVVWQRYGPAAAAAALERDMQVLGPQLDQVGGNLSEIPAAVMDHFALQAGDARAGGALERLGESVRRRRAAGGGPGARSLATLDLLPLLASAWAMGGHWDDALTLVEEGLAWYRSVGAIRATAALRNVRMGVHLYRGMPARVVAEAKQLADEMELDALQAPTMAVLEAQALAWLGRGDEAFAVCEQATAVAGSRPWFVSMGLLAASGESYLVKGAPEQALAHFREAERMADRLGLGHPQLVRWCAGAIESALQAGALGDANRFVAWLGARSAPAYGTWPEMVAIAGAAGCAAAAGDEPEADRLYRQALEAQEENDLDRARIALRYGSWLRRQRRSVESRPLLADVLRLAEERGAVPLATRAATELAAAGGRRRRARNEGALTPQESRVADMAVAGATTKEIGTALYLSPRTVETHLGHIYTKLGIGSRAELRRRHPPAGPPVRTNAHRDKLSE